MPSRGPVRGKPPNLPPARDLYASFGRRENLHSFHYLLNRVSSSSSSSLSYSALLCFRLGALNTDATKCFTSISLNPCRRRRRKPARRGPLKHLARCAAPFLPVHFKFKLCRRDPWLRYFVYSRPPRPPSIVYRTQIYVWHDKQNKLLGRFFLFPASPLLFFN